MKSQRLLSTIVNIVNSRSCIVLKKTNRSYSMNRMNRYVSERTIRQTLHINEIIVMNLYETRIDE